MGESMNQRMNAASSPILYSLILFPLILYSIHHI